MRSFTSAFSALADDKTGLSVYYVLQIDWTSGTKYYLDRPNSFSASGTRVPTIDSPLVLEWGKTSLDLKEGEVGMVDDREIVIDDLNRSITTKLMAANQQWVEVSIWRMFDHATCVWGTDQALMYRGVLKPWSWKLDDNRVRLGVEDWLRKITKTVSHAATRDIFEYVQDPYIDRHLPNCFGKSQRVEMILVNQPWLVHTLEPIEPGTGSVTVYILEHPSDLGIATGVATEVYVDGDLMTVTFSQSATPDTVPSTMTIASSERLIALSPIAFVSGTGASRYGVLFERFINPQTRKDTLETDCPSGTLCEVYSSYWQQRFRTTVAVIDRDNPWPDTYKFVPANTDARDYMRIGDSVRFLDGSSSRRFYPAGVEVSPKDFDWIYVANNLPSKQVRFIEGWGFYQDEAGEGREDFIMIGQMMADIIDGSVTTPNQPEQPYTVNLNDDTWNYTGTGAPEEGTSADLGHNVTTVTFKVSPREYDPRITSNRLWATLAGVGDLEDPYDPASEVITNPVLAILEYLENPALLGIDASDIDVASFTTAAAHSSISSRKVGFAQIEPMEGLALIQDLARQCHCVVFGDMGLVRIVVLENSSPGTTATFDNTSNDNIILNGMAMQDTPIADLSSHVVAKWRAYWDDQTGNKMVDVVRTNDAVKAAFGRRDHADLPIYLYYKRSDVEAEVDFWVARWSRIWRIVELEVSLAGLAVQPGDWISLTYVDAYANTIFSAKALEVVRVDENGVGGPVAIVGRYAAFTY